MDSKCEIRSADDIKKTLNSYLSPIVKIMPNFVDSFKKKNKLYLCAQISNMFNIINNGGHLSREEDGTIIVSIRKERNITFKLKSTETVPEIEEYRIKINDNQVIIEEKKNDLNFNEMYTSNVTNNVISTYKTSLINGYMNCVAIVRESNRVNAFNKTDDNCFVRSINNICKKVYDNNLNVIDIKITQSKQSEYKNYLTLENFLVFDPPLLNDLSEDQIYDIYTTNESGGLISTNYKNRSI